MGNKVDLIINQGIDKGVNGVNLYDVEVKASDKSVK